MGAARDGGERADCWLRVWYRVWLVADGVCEGAEGFDRGLEGIGMVVVMVVRAEIGWWWWGVACWGWSEG